METVVVVPEVERDGGPLPGITLHRFARAVVWTSAAGIGLAAVVHLVTGKTGQGRIEGLVAGGVGGLLLLGSLPYELKRLLGEEGRQRRLGFAGFLVLVKYPLVFLSLYPLLVWKWVDPLGFLGGFAIVQVALVLTGLACSWRRELG
ncbi:MAG: hypothetical protein HY816_01205 [Candidatus Wallbacteria bacterium]|nr:hypothetical protein [Candidatus Wallbacteria bacterium]